MLYTFNLCPECKDKLVKQDVAREEDLSDAICPDCGETAVYKTEEVSETEVKEGFFCEKCEVEMDYSIEGSVQGLRCPLCGSWGLITTYFDEIYVDYTEYNLYIRKGSEINKDKILYLNIREVC